MSSRRLIALVVLAATPLFAACGSSGGDAGSDAAGSSAGDGVAASGTPTTVAPSAGENGGGGALQAGAEGIDASATLACDSNRTLLQTAVDTATLLNGTPPASQDELVGQYLVEAVPGYTIASDGSIQPVEGGPCTGH